MMAFGPIELLIVALVGLGAIVFPLATLVIMFLLYDKVRRIEQAVDRLQSRDADL